MDRGEGESGLNLPECRLNRRRQAFCFGDILSEASGADGGTRTRTPFKGRRF